MNPDWSGMLRECSGGIQMNFTDMGLREELLRAVKERGYSKATPIQSGSIPAILKGRDVLGGAQTGTGKTAAFALPLLHNLSESRGGRHPRVLVLTPTRELAQQVGESFSEYGVHLSLRTQIVFGGVNIKPQIARFKQGCDILVATPGRLLDHTAQKTVSLSHVQTLVLDEADRMLDMGFIHDIRRVLKLLPDRRQNLLFSATYGKDIRNLAEGLLRDPVSVEVTPRNSTAEKVEQCLYRMEQRQKRHLLAHLIQEEGWYQALVFVRTKHGANRLARQLDKKGIPSAAIHGDKSQNARLRALDDFKSGKLQTLIATDVAARGIHLEGLSHVVNYDLPGIPKIIYIVLAGPAGRENPDWLFLWFPRTRLKYCERSNVCPRTEFPKRNAVLSFLWLPSNRTAGLMAVNPREGGLRITAIGEDGLRETDP